MPEITPLTLTQRIRNIKSFVMDIDGVLTDGTLLLLANGEQLRRVNARDSTAISYAASRRYRMGAILEDASPAVTRWLEETGVREIYVNTEKKVTAFEKFIIDQEIDIQNIAYIGDDVNDIAVMRVAGLAVCPADAADEVKKHAHYITHAAGGAGCVREIIEMVLSAHGQWEF